MPGQLLLNGVSPPTTETAVRDCALMRRIREGDFCALNELVAHYWAPVIGFVKGILADADSAEDVAQETFIQLWQRRAAWKEHGSVRSYIYRIARNFALNEQRRQRIRIRWADQLRLHLITLCHATPPDEVLDRGRLQHAINRAIHGLPKRRREVFVLIRYHGLTHQQAARIMGISPQTVANQMTAALTDLRTSLGPVVMEPTQRALGHLHENGVEC